MPSIRSQKLRPWVLYLPRDSFHSFQSLLSLRFRQGRSCGRSCEPSLRFATHDLLFLAPTNISVAGSLEAGEMVRRVLSLVRLTQVLT